ATDVSTQLTKIKPMAPDLILGAVHLEEGIAIMKQAKELGVEPSGGFGETVAPPTPDFSDTLGESAEFVLGSSQWTPQSEGSDDFFGSAQDYAENFKAEFNRTPEYHNAEASAACLAFVMAIQDAGSLEVDAVRQALVDIDEQSFFGAIKFDDQGKNVYKPMQVIQIQDGEPVTVWPEGTAEMQWPASSFTEQ
ncbi:MAG: ABC transporter substrate-binding protein, partial [Candidatus Limnocylindria bacterium]